jgi:hypothetical protein
LAPVFNAEELASAAFLQQQIVQISPRPAARDSCSWLPDQGADLIVQLNHAMQCYLVCDLTHNLTMLWQQRTDYEKPSSHQKSKFSDVLPHDCYLFLSI